MNLLDRYQNAAFELLKKAQETQRDAVEKAGRIIADAAMEGKHIYLGSICHSMEYDLYNRGGGLVFYQIYEAGKTKLESGDVLLVSSVSGRTLSIVELAYNSVQQGVRVIAFTSMEYATVVDAVHPSGKKLYEFVDCVVDNCAPAAEAMLTVDGLESKFAAASGLASDFLLWSITAVVVERMMASGCTPGVLKSFNYQDGPEYNANIRKHFAECGW